MSMRCKIIYGPPGTGKTSTLIAEAAAHKDPLFVAFTRSAADEINARLERKVAKTLHSYCYQALELLPAAVVDRKKLAQFADIVNVPISGGGQDENGQIGDDYLAVISHAAARRENVMEAFDRFGRPGTPGEFAYFSEAYAQWKRANGLMDFDDMLWVYCANVDRPTHPTVLLDEAQDLTPMQWEVFNRITSNSDDIIVAGDDDQAIYEWMGADPHGMSTFRMGYGTGWSSQVLKKSHRVPPDAHRLALQVIEQVAKRTPKDYAPRAGGGLVKSWNEARPLVEAFKRTNHAALWLFRDRYQMYDVQRQLNRAYVPYSIAGGRSPWTSYRAQGVRAWLELRQGAPGEQCRARLAKAATDKARALLEAGDFATIRTMRPDHVVTIPQNQRDFYLDCLTWAALEKPVALELSTIHRAKGREHDTVVVTLAASTAGLVNLYKSRDAELRTLYVALTRTMRALHLHGSHPLVPA